MSAPTTEVGTRSTPAGAGLAELYAQVQQFYAAHFHLLDSGDAHAWAETFTEDGWFWPQVLPEPVRGRAALRAGVLRTREKLAAANEQHRHWHGMVHVQPVDERTVAVRCYAQIFAIPAGGPARLHLHCVCEDVLVREGDEWKVRQRKVVRDDLPPRAF
ncbi:nuclear transport factor 2 family protein [Micromonospora sp. NPDC050980]|uniref:nuclear transport factor 2 family protein n=1 Tax=Micromonospora sp. NPDC050980 TaxID=3155161 RepID=UPI00340417CB